MPWTEALATTATPIPTPLPSLPTPRLLLPLTPTTSLEFSQVGPPGSYDLKRNEVLKPNTSLKIVLLSPG